MRPIGKLAVALWAALGIAACGSLGDDIKLCGQIPEGGCPLGRGGTCEDTACAALYDCVNGHWTQEVTCAPGVGGGGGGGTGGAGGAPVVGTGAGGCTPVTFDHSAEVGGCTPELQSPECPAVAAEGCAETVCLTECLDFFLCEKEGWAWVAYCDELTGQLTLISRP